MSVIAEWHGSLRKAKELREEASTCTDPDEKADLLHRAARYEEWAEEARHDSIIEARREEAEEKADRYSNYNEDEHDR